MGAELGINDFANVNFNNPLPKHMVDARIQPDLGDDPPPDVQMPWFFMQSLPIAGLLHVVSNAAKDVHKALLGFS
eukprot:10263938-Alexandrium_andersonii.AAC.1